MYDDEGWMWNHGWGWGWSGWILTGLVMVVFWAVVITLVILAIRYFTSEFTSERSGAGDADPVGRGINLFARQRRASETSRMWAFILP